MTSRRNEFLIPFLRQMIVDTVLSQNGWTMRQYPVLEKIVVELSRQDCAVSAMTILRDMANHSSNLVRVKVIDLIALVSKHTDKRSIKHVVSSVMLLSSDMHQDVRKQSVKAVLSLLCGDLTLSDVERQNLTEQLKVIASDPSHSVALNLLRALVRFNHSGKNSFRNVLMVEILACVCRRVVQDANELDHEKKLWTHSESSEIATAIVSTAQAVWQSLSLGGQKELKVPLVQLMRTYYISARFFFVCVSYVFHCVLCLTHTHTHTHRNGRENRSN